MSIHKSKVGKLVICSDNGTRYMNRKFKDTLNVLQVNHEYIWNHMPEKNGHVKSFHKTLKKEYLWPHDFTSFQEVKVVLSSTFIDYNQSRIHSSLIYVTPNEFVESWRDRNNLGKV
ncbi:MAG: integrase core domain-containing protein [Candidatus Nitrosoabyssus spongiisocia]|nr:MAG: integrase core domain-containing protein [Nitrosopumilaceae archaeon AB1(1)]